MRFDRPKGIEKIKNKKSFKHCKQVKVEKWNLQYNFIFSLNRTLLIKESANKVIML